MTDAVDLFSWADETIGEEDDEKNDDAFQTIKDGIKTTVNYVPNSKGKLVKVEKKHKVHKKTTKLNKNALQRRELMMAKPFNIDTREGAGVEPSEIQFDYHNKAANDDQSYQFADLDKVKPINMRTMKTTAMRDDIEEPRHDLEDTTRKYIPKRIGMPDEIFGIRVTNLSEEVTEQDLYELFSKHCKGNAIGKGNGPINKVHLAKNKDTGEPKGFAFVHYHTREDAATAIKKLHRHGYDNRILTVEWAKPPAKDKEIQKN
eukprot:Selendium_serpulae@DN5847_c0_g1_i2.p2